MKKSTKITYYAHIVFMSIIMILNLLGLMLNEDTSVKSIYLFDLIQSVLFLTTIILTPTTMKKGSIQLSDVVYIILVLFCLAHFFLGEICGFYAKVVWWDSVLHTFSGMIITFLSFSVISLLNDSKKSSVNLNMRFSCLFAFCMAITVGVIWEIIEFTSDSLFLTNMQRAYESIAEGGARGEPLIGQAALYDTMKDLILDALGSITTCVLCSIFCTKKKIGLDKLSVIKIARSSNLKEDTKSKLAITESTNKNIETNILNDNDKLENYNRSELIENNELIKNSENNSAYDDDGNISNNLLNDFVSDNASSQEERNSNIEFDNNISNKKLSKWKWAFRNAK